MQFTEELQGHWVIGLQTGGELVDQPRLLPHQAAVVARQELQFLGRCRTRLQGLQVRLIRAEKGGQDVGIEGIAF